MSKIKDFDPSKETWQRFVARLRLHFTTEDIADDPAAQPKRKAMLLQLMGIELYNKFLDSAGDDLTNLTFIQIVERVNNLVNPQPLEIAERFRFLNRRQQQGESAAEYMGALRKMALTCNFANDAAEPNSARLRDQFVCGLAKRDMQQFLLQQQQLTVDNVVNLATSFESAEKTTEMINQQFSVKTDVNKVGTSVVKNDKRKKPGTESAIKCEHCGRTNHPSEKCFKLNVCKRCGRKGHTPKFCYGNKSKANASQAVDSGDGTESEEEFGRSNHVHSVKSFDGAAKYFVDISCNGYKLALELDTGTGETILNKQNWERMGSPKLGPTTKQFKSYSGHELKVLGCASMSVEFCGQKFPNMPFFIVEGTKNSLLGRRWLEKMDLELKQCRRQESSKQKTKVAKITPKASRPSDQEDVMKKLLSENSELFDGKLGCIKGVQVSLTVSPNKNVKVKKFWPARPVPFAIEKKVEMELDRLERRGIIQKIPNDVSEYASPIVVVSKRNSGAVRICGDFKVSINKMLIVEQYPLPNAEQLFAKVGDCKYFAKLDLEEAYHQLELDEEAQKLLVINTKKGLYRYKRLPFGIASAPAIFQRTIDLVLRGLPGVICYLDDITVASRTPEEHESRLRAVFQRLKEFNIKLGLGKCSLGEKSIKYLGHIIDGDGLHTTPDKIEAIRLAPAPKNVGELRSFLGLVNYYGKFINNLSSLCSRFYKLLHKDVPRQWNKEHELDFQKLKEVMCVPLLFCAILIKNCQWVWQQMRLNMVSGQCCSIFSRMELNDLLRLLPRH